MTRNKIKVLIAEDSHSVQMLLSYIIQKDPLLEVCGIVPNGKEVLQAIKSNRPDVILMDIVMPIMDGIEATRQIMETDPIPIIIVSSHYNNKELDVCMEALQMGAVALLEKPIGLQDPKYEYFAKELVGTIKTVSEIKLITRHRKKKEALAKIDPSKQKYAVIAIGASLGGPQALLTIFSSLPANFPLPILVVQHIAPGFAAGLVEWLNRNTVLKVTLAQENEPLLPGYIYFAPSKNHLEINKDQTIKLIEDKENSAIVPSVSRLFKSVSQVFGPKCIGVLLTGMGHDGADGLLLMKQKGALTIVQDEDSCIVFGMPKEAIHLGAATKVLPLNEIAAYLKTVV